MKRILIIATLALAACTGSPAATTDSEEAKTGNALEYQYEPAVSTLHGTLTSKVYFGPPGYGEDTLADEKERTYVLVLDKGIAIQQPKKDLSDGYNAAIGNVTHIQLLNQESLDKYLNKTVSVTGTLFGAQTGHHHTDVLLDLKSIK
jgi:uncharacterized protein DUF4431